MKKALSVIAAVLFALSAMAGILLAVVDAYVTDPSFYKKEYEKLNTAADIGITQQELNSATSVLLDYTTGARDNLDVTAVIGGESQQVFGERERAHMQDVRALYLGAMVIKRAALIFAGVLLFLVLINAKRSERALFARCSLITWTASVALFGALGAWAALDFNSFWTAFHHVFFTNDLWLLDPATDVLVMMVPEPFFFDLSISIVLTFAAAYTFFAALLGIWLLYMKRTAQR